MLPRPLVIFLDLDGVFKTGRSILARMRFDPLISKLVNDLCRLPGTRVVISATCRLNFKEGEKEECQAFWRDLGMPDLTLHDDWYTNRNPDARTLEIQDWLERHTDEEHNTVEYLILDDEMPTYKEGLKDWSHSLLLQSWLFVSGYKNGANYNQLRTLRDMFDERKKAYEEATSAEKACASIGIIAERKTAESNRALGSITADTKAAVAGGEKLSSVSADAQLGFKGIDTRHSGTISIAQHVFACKQEGCIVCTALFDPRSLLPGFQSHEIPERSDDAAAHDHAEAAKQSFEGS